MTALTGFSSKGSYAHDSELNNDQEVCVNFRNGETDNKNFQIKLDLNADHTVRDKSDVPVFHATDTVKGEVLKNIDFHRFVKQPKWFDIKTNRQISHV